MSKYVRALMYFYSLQDAGAFIFYDYSYYHLYNAAEEMFKIKSTTEQKRRERKRAREKDEKENTQRKLFCR